jgi:hypothetical protein
MKGTTREPQVAATAATAAPGAVGPAPNGRDPRERGLFTDLETPHAAQHKTASSPTNGATQDPAPNRQDPSPRDIFADLEGLRFTGQAVLESAVEVLATVPVKKPVKTWFIRTHPDPRMYLEAGIWLDPDQRDEIFLVVPKFTGFLDEQVKSVTLIPSITRQGTVFLWPCPRLSDDPGQRGPTGWGESARQAADLARNRWLRLQPDMQLGAYRLVVAQGDLSEPKWPERPLQDLLRIAFGPRVIDRADHPVILRLRGLV